MYEWLTGVYGGGRVFFCELGFEECRRVLDGLIALGVPPYIPVTVLVNGTVRAILVGEYTDRVFVGKLLSLPVSERIPVYLGRELAGYVDRAGVEGLLAELATYTVGETGTPASHTTATTGTGAGATRLLVYTVTLAAVDSVNPCVLLLLLALLATVLATSGRRSAVYSTVAFTTAVYASYLALGLGLYKLMYFVPRWVMPVTAVAYGALTLTNTLGSTVASKLLNHCPACRVYEGTVKRRLGRAATPTLWSGLLGVASSLTLLPCTAGPYIIFTKLISEVPLQGALALLLLYNLIFVTPLLGVAATYITLARTPQLIETLTRHERKIRAAGAVAVIALGIYLYL